MGASNIARLLTISGVVQGVGFRFFAQRAAAKHQVRGYVRNLDDGRVETLAEGERAAVEGFQQDMNVGPRFARVDLIEEIVVEPSGLYSTFRIEK
jgi:acylphosphatase